jgi:hypothetical protein
MTRNKRAMPWPAKPWMTALVLLAFVLQCLAVQTHIHQLIQPVAKAASLHVPVPAPPKNQGPIDHCRLCQELVHAGAFVTPLATAVFAELSFVAAIFAALPAFAGAYAKPFAWQSRAPPRR